MTDQPDGLKKEDEKHFESFPETKMMPSGWDFLTEPAKQTETNEVDSDQSNSNETELPQSSKDKMKFPEPHAYPKGWDIPEG